MAVLKDNLQQFLQCVPVVSIFVLRMIGLTLPAAPRWMDLNRRVLFVSEYTGTSSGYQNNNRG